jgi:RHS repeat-associated protein
MGDDTGNASFDNFDIKVKEDLSVTDTTPEFSSIYDDTDTSDTAEYYQIQVIKKGGSFSSPFSNTGKTSMTSISEGTRTADLSSTTTLPLDGTTYYWRMKLWDNDGMEGAWSNGNDFFTTQDQSGTTFTSGTTIQDLTYTYDKIGNITQIIDDAGTDTSGTTTYQYDDLSRLTQSSKTQTGNNLDYTRNYTYSPLGNIASNHKGTYLYQGNQGSSYANPHAVTSINGTTYLYDANGNLIADDTHTYSWDYRNRLIQSKGGGDTTYTYDQSGQRVFRVTDSATTTYPNTLYNVSGTTKTKHILANNENIATIETVGGTTTIYTSHTDHLTGSNVILDENANPTELFDYFPFGEERVHGQNGTFSEQRGFTGQEYDRETKLSYMKARYQSGEQGRFISQDPVFWNTPERFVADPQQLNSYSYTRNNPINGTDPTGEAFTPETALDVASVGLSAIALTGAIRSGDPLAIAGVTFRFNRG